MYMYIVLNTQHIDLNRNMASPLNVYVATKLVHDTAA